MLCLPALPYSVSPSFHLESFRAYAQALSNNPKVNTASSGQNGYDTNERHLQIVDRLAAATVAVIGLGGVGSWAAEALCRSGVGNLVLIDLDDICISNTNRQLHATSSSVGQMKIDEMRRRILDINPQCSVTNIHEFITVENIGGLLDSLLPDLTVCLDAIDDSKAKTSFLAACTDRKIPVVTCGGAAGRTDPTKIVCNDLTRVEGDRLLKTCRANLRKLYGFPEGASAHSTALRKIKKWRIHAVYSTETAKNLPEDRSDPDGNNNKVSSLRRCDSALGTVCFVTGTVGFVAAGKVVDMIATSKFATPKRPWRPRS